MPGFLIFDELGMDEKFPNMPGMQKAVMKSALAMMPGSWTQHGMSGEYNVDVDPVAEINKALDGGGAIGSMAGSIKDGATSAAESAGEGDAAGVAAGVASGVTGVLGTFWEAYKGWIPVASVSQSFNSEANPPDPDEAKEDAITRKAATLAGEISKEEVKKETSEVLDKLADKNPSLNVDIDESEKPTSSGKKFTTKMSGEASGVEKLTVNVHVDTSFPKLMKAALKPEGEKNGPKIFPSADVHLCTVASIDTRQLTMGSDSSAAQLIQTLIGFFYFNVVPYVTISMKDVQVSEVSFNLQGNSDGAVPTATVILEYKEITWAYHVINGSNMNLITLEFGYDISKHEPIEAAFGGASVGSTLNPFA